MDRTLRRGDPADVGMSKERIERIRRLCADWVEQGITPSLQVLVARRGTIVLHDAGGRLGPETDAPSLTTDSIFGIGSITKPITATVIMGLVEDGLLGLNRPVQEYVPELVGEGKEAVMVHHLLTHISGLRAEELTAHGLAKIAAGQAPPREPMPYLRPEELVHFPDPQAVLDAPLWNPPGVEMSYLNHGYCLLTEIIERVAGQPADRVFQERIFDPLGLTSASFGGLSPDRLERYVRRPDDAPWALLNYPDRVRALASGGGAVSLRAFDLAVFGQMFLNGGSYGGVRILSPASIAEMTRNQIPGVSA
jgi:CubicO group peptidase (beta-lactamase class C family)